MAALSAILILPSVFGLPDGAALLPPRGWSSWNSFGLNINEEVKDIL